MTTEVMPAAFIGHGNPVNALETNRYTQAWHAFGRAVPRPRQHLGGVLGQTGGSWTLTTAERPPCTTASASFSTWGSSPASDTVTP